MFETELFFKIRLNFDFISDKKYPLGNLLASLMVLFLALDFPESGAPAIISPSTGRKEPGICVLVFFALRKHQRSNADQKNPNFYFLKSFSETMEMYFNTYCHKSYGE